MEYTRKALLQSTPGLNEIITNDLLNAARMGIEHAMFFGDEDRYTTQPRGIINEENIGAIDDATTNWGKIVQLEAAVASANADVDTMYYVMSPAVRGVLKSDQKFSGAGVVAEPIMREDQLLNGYSTAVSTILKPDLPLLDKYLIFGDFSQELLGYFGNIDVLVNPYVGDTSRIIRVTVAADVSCRLRNPGAIAVDNSIELPTP